jgi:glycerol-3-phosphate dehydrogenase
VTLVGTTDLDHAGDLNTEANITPAELRYLLAATADQFPGLHLGRADVVACYAGVRPVVSPGEDKNAKASQASRDHVVLDESGLITVTGGKLTTFRLMAQDALAWSLVTFRCLTLRFTPEPGEATTVVVVAVEISVFCRPISTAPVETVRSPQEA